jgi:hypothetical protein
MVNRSKSIQLMADNCGLRIMPDKNEWSKVSLLMDNTERPLGGETYKSISTKLLKFLSEDNIKSPTRQWILTLSELHHVLYGTHDGDGMTICVQNGDAQWIAEFKLGNEQIKKWMSALSTD